MNRYGPKWFVPVFVPVKRFLSDGCGHDRKVRIQYKQIDIMKRSGIENL